MLVEQIAVNNSLRNYMYLIACEETKRATAIDPLDHASILAKANELGWTIESIINTHEHHDHIDGNGPVVEATRAKIYAHAMATDKIPNVDVGLNAGDLIKVGTSVELHALDTPGHTFCHTCLYFAGADNELPALFCGDTLFNAGVGNCHHGGDPQVMYQTFVEQLFVLPEHTRVYPGHDYILNNLGFTLDREPDNTKAQELLETIQNWNEDKHFISDLALEKQVNAFFRLTNPQIIEQLNLRFPELGSSPSEESVFLKLRELRNHW